MPALPVIYLDLTEQTVGLGRRGQCLRLPNADAGIACDLPPASPGNP